MKILVVDDEPVSREALAELAEAAAGQPPSVATDGRAAWARLDGGEAVGLVLSEIRLPRLSGVELVARMRADPRFEHLPVMLVSSAHDREAVESAMQAGIQGFVLKPVMHGTLERIRHVMDRFRQALVERNTQAMTRLGVDPCRFDAYVAALVTQGQVLADRLAGAVKAQEERLFQELKVAVKTQRVVASTLGANKLVPVLAWLEKCLESASERGGLPQALAAYRLNLYWLQCVKQAMPA
jgi:two-component system chemotaxis response regulator CheY